MVIRQIMSSPKYCRYNAEVGMLATTLITVSSTYVSVLFVLFLVVYPSKSIKLVTPIS